MLGVVLPIVTVQIDPVAPVAVLEERLLGACSAGLERTRCVSSRAEEALSPRAVAVVSWNSELHASIEVGLYQGEEPLWISRELAFEAADPEVERWRAVGFTIALLVNDPRLEQSAAVPAEPVDSPLPEENPSAPAPPPRTFVEARARAGSGVVSGPLRWGGGVRLEHALGVGLFVTGGVNYAIASDTALEARWLDVSAGAGFSSGALLPGIESSVRLELLFENVGVTVRRGELTDRASAWVPGVSLGADLRWPLSDHWSFGAGAEAFWLDGSTAVDSAGQRVASLAGAGVLLGLGVGYRF